jgi:DinB family protein
MTTNPYGRYVEGRDPIASLEETSAHIASLVRGWPRSHEERPWAPGKWTGRQILAHLAHIEMVFSTRLRFAVAEDGYVVQPFEQDDWMAAEPAVPALAALDVYLALRTMNLGFCRALDSAALKRIVRHPEVGDITVKWIIEWCAGHERHHVPQLEAIRT